MSPRQLRSGSRQGMVTPRGYAPVPTASHDDEGVLAGPVESGGGGDLAGLANILGGHKVLSCMLLSLPLGILAHHAEMQAEIVFLFNFVAIIPLAWLIGKATEDVSAKVGQTLGGLMNATFGNVVEMLLCITGIRNGEIEVVQCTLLGSILSNLLLVMGCSFLFGGLFFPIQKYNRDGAAVQSSLLAMSVFAVALPTIYVNILEQESEWEHMVTVGYIGRFLARVVQMVSSLRSIEAQMVQAKRGALLFMRKRAMPKALQFRVLRYIEHVYETDAVTSMDQVTGILSESLRNQLTLAITGNVLRQFRLFETAHKTFLGVICEACRTMRAGVGDTVVSEGQRAHEMYWIVRGAAAVLKRNCKVAILQAGDWFGELGLFLPGAVRKVTVLGETNCELLALAYDDFHSSVELFPDVRRECERIAEQLMSGNALRLKNKCAYCGSMDHSMQRCAKAQARF